MTDDPKPDFTTHVTQVKHRMVALHKIVDELRVLHHEWVRTLIENNKGFRDAEAATLHFRQWLIARRKTQ